MAAAELSDGSVLDVDFVIVGIGVTPNDRLARRSGLDVGNGIVVDEHTRSSDKDIHAVGIARCCRGGASLCVSNQSRTRLIRPRPPRMYWQALKSPMMPNPGFWSDQYEVKLQIAGFNLGYDETVLRPGAREGSWSVWYFRDGRFVAVDAVNDAKAYVSGKTARYRR